MIKDFSDKLESIFWKHVNLKNVQEEISRVETEPCGFWDMRFLPSLSGFEIA